MLTGAGYHMTHRHTHKVYPLKKAVFYWNTADINRLFCWPGQQKQSLNTIQSTQKTNIDGCVCQNYQNYGHFQSAARSDESHSGQKTVKQSVFGNIRKIYFTWSSDFQKCWYMIGEVECASSSGGGCEQVFRSVFVPRAGCLIVAVVEEAEPQLWSRAGLNSTWVHLVFSERITLPCWACWIHEIVAFLFLPSAVKKRCFSCWNMCRTSVFTSSSVRTLVYSQSHQKLWYLKHLKEIQFQKSNQTTRH